MQNTTPACILITLEHVCGLCLSEPVSSTSTPQQLSRHYKQPHQPPLQANMWLMSCCCYCLQLLRGAGCTINDLWDRDIDRQVARTRQRPLAAGTITPTQALVFLAGQLTVGLAILLQLNIYTQVLGASSLLLVGTYPLMKRVTNWPQAFLGLTFNWGALMGYSAVAGTCNWAVVLPLYFAGVNWTLVYDTIYAHQDKKDDLSVGVKSTALYFGDNTRQWLTGFAALQTAAMLTTGYMAGCGMPFQIGVVAAALQQARQISSVDLNNGPDCMAKFVSNKWYGLLIFAGIVADRALAAGLIA